jgi:hypothetical protein
VLLLETVGQLPPLFPDKVTPAVHLALHTVALISTHIRAVVAQVRQVAMPIQTQDPVRAVRVLPHPLLVHLLIMAVVAVVVTFLTLTLVVLVVLVVAVAVHHLAYMVVVHPEQPILVAEVAVRQVQLTLLVLVVAVVQELLLSLYLHLHIQAYTQARQPLRPTDLILLLSSHLQGHTQHDYC